MEGVWSKKRLNGACLMQYRLWTQYNVELQYSTAQHSTVSMVWYSTAGQQAITMHTAKRCKTHHGPSLLLSPHAGRC
jgi:hypothetical protein